VQDYQRLLQLTEISKAGAFPDLGQPHPKAGYRYCLGKAKFENGVVQPWRENLGQDKFIAQYRARAMVHVWAMHVHMHGNTDIKEIPPLDRAKARAEMLKEVNLQINHAQRIADEFNQKQLQPFPSPGFKLVAVRTEVPDSEASKDTNVLENTTPAELMLHGATHRWIAELKAKYEKDEGSESYLARAERIMLDIRRLIADRELACVGKDDLKEIRRIFQHLPIRRGPPLFISLIFDTPSN